MPAVLEEIHAPVNCVPEHLGFSLVDILVLVGTAGASKMAPPTSARISARLKGVQGPSLTLAQPIAAYYYKYYYKNAGSECMPVIPIVIPI